MQSQTAKMIYPQATVASMIAGKLTKSMGLKYEVHKVATGYQVVSVTKCPPYMPPVKAAPVKKPVGLMGETNMSGTTTPGIELVLIELKFRGESNVYVDAWTNDGKQISFGTCLHMPTLVLR